MAKGRDRSRRRRSSKKEAAIALQEEEEAEDIEEEALEETEEEEEQSLAVEGDDSESDLFFEPHSPPSSSPPPHPTSNNNNIVYFLLNFIESNPVSQALYAVDASPPMISEHHSDNNLRQSSSEKTIYPVFEFTNQDGFPNRMCCAVLDSRIYFLGGYVAGDLSVGFPHRIFSKKVYYIDAANIPLTPTDPRSVVRKAAPMTTGKPQCYCFVALGQLFAIGVQDWSPLKVFEVYDPKLNKWTPLPDPPITTFVVSDAVVDNKVILRTRTQEFYLFDAATGQWENFAHIPGSTASCYGGVIRRGIFVDNDTIYWNYFDTVISSGPTSRADPADKVNDFMTRVFRSASDKLANVIHSFEMYNCVSTRLQYLGNRIFASVICCAVENSEDRYLRDCPGDPEKSKASIVVFEIPKEEEGDQKDTRFKNGSRFKVNILHTARFECRSNKGADHSHIYLEECFSISI